MDGGCAIRVGLQCRRKQSEQKVKCGMMRMGKKRGKRRKGKEKGVEA